MESYLRPPILVPIEHLYPDPNNPRLALDDPPGFADKDRLYDEATRTQIFDEIGQGAYEIDDLVAAIEGQGWMPIDNIIVWQHPDEKQRHVVVEGNRRRVALETIRTVELPKARKKLDRMEARPGGFADQQVAEQRALVARLERIISDTEVLSVVPLDATDVAELEHKLPRVLAVRHITGAKEWGNYAEDLWLLNRYHHLFEDAHGPVEPFWDEALIRQVAGEASLGQTKARWQLKAASWFSHFKAEWEDELPEDGSFEKTDYYLFEIISRKPWLRGKLGIGDDDFAIPADGESVLFAWTFAEHRGRTADDNDNVFYRHENLEKWDAMKRYDDKHGTSFAARFDVANPDEAPTFREVEADWLGHKARRKPHALLDELLRRLKDLTADTLASEGRNLRAQLEQLRDQSERFLRMVDAADD